ncbi:hypothetical protein TRVA0_059S00628 [Trichomonascus vanleenenianus]|uniref:uncharacterized protein n=1 Tax=Trichomonascus vanleenenianus TaxID=2268995 RepID=UPI003ECA515F
MKSVEEVVDKEPNREVSNLARASLARLKADKKRAEWEDVFDSTDPGLSILRLMGVVEMAKHGATAAMLDRLELALRDKWPDEAALRAYSATVLANISKILAGHKGLSVYYTHVLARTAQWVNEQPGGPVITLVHCELARFAYTSRCYRIARKILGEEYYEASEQLGALSTEKICAFFYYAGNILYEERQYAKATESLSIALGSSGLFFEKYAAYNLWSLSSVLVNGTKQSLPAGARMESVDEDGLITRYSNAVLAFQKTDLEASLDTLHSTGKDDTRPMNPSMPLAAVAHHFQSGDEETMPFGVQGLMGNAGSGRKRTTEGEMADSAVQRQIASYASDIDDNYDRKLRRMVDRRKELYVESQKKAFTSVETSLLSKSLATGTEPSPQAIEDYILRLLFYKRDDFAVCHTKEGTYVNFACHTRSLDDKVGELEKVLGKAVDSSNRLNDLNLETVASPVYNSIIHHPLVNVNTLQDMRVDGSRQQAYQAGRRTRLRPDKKHSELMAQGLDFDMMASGGSSESED